MSLSSEPKAKEIDDEVSETSDSGVAAPTRHVKMRARQDNGLRTPPWTPGTLGVGRGEGWWKSVRINYQTRSLTVKHENHTL